MRFGHATVIFVTRRGLQTVRALVPRTVADRATGLRGARFLPRNTGMLFEFEERHRPVLTMRGVLFPLDMIFIGSLGASDTLALLATQPAVPGQAQVVGPLGTRYVLEVAAGFVRQHGLRPAQIVRVSFR